jgi:UDP-N-acetylglucosamine--N-acetylmuramyl-(pentapeptide) pyrophosphoryl-undecaprenol N-acetylglucosamine transferase
MRIAFAAGGTAGHLYPALCTADELRRRDRLFEALFLVSRRGREREILEQYGFPCEEVPASGFGGALSLRIVPAVATMLSSYRTSRALMRGRGTQALIGYGAYVSVPPALAARALGLKVIIHEQNAVMGRANRVLARLADRVALGLPLSDEHRWAERGYLLTGIPLRPEMLQGVTREEARGYLGVDPGAFTVLVMGGSQGARAINRMVAEGSGLLAKGGDLQVVHLSGRGDYDSVVRAYARVGLRAVVVPYLREMEWAYAAADLAVCRAGAMTLAELAQSGLPSVLIPYPRAVGDHQAANGRLFERIGAALLRDESGLSAEGLAAIILSLKRDAAAMKKMSAAARSLASPHAAQRLADLIEETVCNP